MTQKENELRTALLAILDAVDYTTAGVCACRLTESIGAVLPEVLIKQARKALVLNGFQVFNNGKPAQFPEHNVHPSWHTSIFEQFDEAVKYARKWLGCYDPGVNYKFELSTPCYYEGGNVIEIKRVEV